MANKRETVDYVKILKKILKLLNNECAVEKVVMDFERATWRAFQQVFPNAIRLRGCAFHWTQSLFRNLKKIGLVPVCRSNRVQILCKRAMSLHLLPPTKIVKLFPKLNKVSVRFGQKFYANQTFFFI